jgi:hypothetical protein
MGYLPLYIMSLCALPHGITLLMILSCLDCSYSLLSSLIFNSSSRVRVFA